MNPIYLAAKSKLTDLVLTALDKYKQKQDVGALTDLYVQLNPSTLAVAVYDDEERLLAELLLPELEDLGRDSNENIFRLVENLIHDVMAEPEVISVFDEMDTLKPFSLLLVDDQFEHKAEIYLLDEGNLVIEDSLFKDIDKELDAFLDKLMKS